ncbi:MAG: DotU family type IV/VI secretion system protein [Planctomycetota bacterium]
MNPHIAAVADPIFLKVLALMERVDKDDVASPDWERQSLENSFREADSALAEGSGWNLAKYALASWVDDLLIASPWKGRDWWESNSLEFAFFKSRDRATKFFTKAKEAAELTQRDALEVFYLCVVLGFRGLYDLSERELLASQLDLPMSIAAWRKNTAAALQLRQGRPPIRDAPRVATGAPPLESRYLAAGSAVVTVILSVVLATLAWLSAALASSAA